MIDFNNVAKHISDYGIMLVISSVFIYTCIRLLNVAIKHIEGKLGDKNHEKLIDLRNDINEKVHCLIDEFLVSSKSERIQIMEFSNSVKSVAYLPFKYMTCTYEVRKFGEPSIGHTIDRMSTSLFTPFFCHLQSKPYVLFDTSNKDVVMGGAMYDLLKTHGSDKTLCTMLYTAKGKAIGYISLKKSEDFTESDILGLQSLSKQVSALLGILDR